MSRSEELFERAKRVTPGGVHSPVRSFKSVGGSPVFVDSADGAQITDVDGNTYIDFCMAFGPLILGHNHPAVKAAVIKALNKGWSYGAAETASLRLAELITDNIDWVDSVRFVNSGTEAVMSALRLARAATGRDKILKFDGCYHGHTDAMLIRAGSGLAASAVTDSAGVPAGVSQDTLVSPLDDEDSLEKIFSEQGKHIAAVIIEPVPANHGLLPQRHVFLEYLAKLCKANGALLIFDEIITGFRLTFGGFTQASGLRPDIVTWGKIIGGGFPVGAVAGRADLMNQFAPEGPVYQAGTLSANPVAMAAGYTTLEILMDGQVYTHLDELGHHLEARMAEIPDVIVQRYDSLFWLVATGENNAGVIRSKGRTPGDIAGRYVRLFQNALKTGIYLPPSPYEVGFLSAAHSRNNIDQLVDSLK
jgi:glutamate-1-semialdehyde 2,1-aminomutase